MNISDTELLLQAVLSAATAINQFIHSSEGFQASKELKQALKKCNHIYQQVVGIPLPLVRNSVESKQVFCFPVDMAGIGDNYVVSLYDVSDDLFSNEEDMISQLIYKMPIEMAVGETLEIAIQNARNLAQTKGWEIFPDN